MQKEKQLDTELYNQRYAIDRYTVNHLKTVNNAEKNHKGNFVSKSINFMPKEFSFKE
jgi:protoporphyrinogen oxidase